MIPLQLFVDTYYQNRNAFTWCSRIIIQKPRSFAQSPVLIVIIRIYWVMLVKDPMVAQQQPKSLQRHYLLTTCITTANGDRKQPTANQTIFWFCDTKKQSPTAASVAHCFLRPEKTLKKQNSLAFHLWHKTLWRKNTLHSANQKTQCGGSDYLFIYVSIYLSVCLSVYLSICKLENEAILRDCLSF